MALVHQLFHTMAFKWLPCLFPLSQCHICTQLLPPVLCHVLCSRWSWCHVPVLQQPCLCQPCNWFLLSCTGGGCRCVAW